MKIFAGALAALALAFAGSAQALTTQIAGLYNTGVDATGLAVTTGNGADLHWSLGGGTAYTGGTNGQFPIPPWLAENPTDASRWITPTNNAAIFPADLTNGIDGLYHFTLSFTLPQFVSASFSGRLSSDNATDGVTLNGHALTLGALPNPSDPPFTQWQSFGASSFFQAGTNVVDVTVRNYGCAACSGQNPMGLRLEFSGSSLTVPEPATWALMLMGFFGMGLGLRARKAVGAVA